MGGDLLDPFGGGKHEHQFARIKSPHVDGPGGCILAVEDILVDDPPVLDRAEAKVITIAGVYADEPDFYTACVDDESLIPPIDGVCVRLSGAPRIQREDENDEAATKESNPLPGGETETSSLRLHHTPAPLSGRLTTSTNANKPRFLSATARQSLPTLFFSNALRT
jgi:hypothetical protein